MLKKFALAATVAVLASTSAHAAALGGNVTVPFSGVIDSSCSLELGNAGTFGVSADRKILSTGVGNGITGSVSVTADEGFVLSASNPSTFLSAPTGVSDPAFTSELTFKTEMVEGGDGSIEVPAGQDQAYVDLSVVRSGGKAFLPGTYDAAVVVTCEPSVGVE